MSWLGFGERRVDEYAYTQNGRELVSRTDFERPFRATTQRFGSSLSRIGPTGSTTIRSWVEVAIAASRHTPCKPRAPTAPSHAGTVFVFDEQQSETVTERSSAGEWLVSQTVKGFHFPDEFGNFASVEQVFSTEGNPYAESISTDTEYLHAERTKSRRVLADRSAEARHDAPAS